MPPEFAPEIKEASDALVKIASPNIFAPTMAIVMLVVMLLLLYDFRTDWREERRADNIALQRIADSIRDLDRDFREAGIKRRVAVDARGSE